MKIRFIVEIDASEYSFIIDTNKLPGSIGNKEVALKDFEILEQDEPRKAEDKDEDGGE